MTGLDLDIVQLTQHWVRINDTWYRDAWVRDRQTGGLRFVAILDELL